MFKKKHYAKLWSVRRIEEQYITIENYDNPFPQKKIEKLKLKNRKKSKFSTFGIKKNHLLLKKNIWLKSMLWCKSSALRIDLQVILSQLSFSLEALNDYTAGQFWYLYTTHGPMAIYGSWFCFAFFLFAQKDNEDGTLFSAIPYPSSTCDLQYARYLCMYAETSHMPHKGPCWGGGLQIMTFSPWC